LAHCDEDDRVGQDVDGRFCCCVVGIVGIVGIVDVRFRLYTLCALCLSGSGNRVVSRGLLDFLSKPKFPCVPTPIFIQNK